MFSVNGGEKRDDDDVEDNKDEGSNQPQSGEQTGNAPTADEGDENNGNGEKSGEDNKGGDGDED